MIGSLVEQVAVVIGLNEAIKQSLLTEAQYKYIPVISVLLGVLVNILLFGADSLQSGVLNGVATGLSAVGLFKLTKNVGKTEVRDNSMLL